MKFSIILGCVLLFLGLVSFDAYKFHKEFFGGPSVVKAKNPVDVIVVLTGGVGRMRRGVELFLEGKGEHLFVSGVAAGVSIESVFKANGIDPVPSVFYPRIIVGNLSRSTPENAREIRSVLERHDFNSMILVTSSYHIARASQLVARELSRWPERKISLYFEVVDSPNFEPYSWWKTLTGWQIFLSEYFKSFAIRLDLDGLF